MKIKTIYAVSAGNCSDYHIVAVFSSKKLAENFMLSVKSDHYNDIEEYQLDPPAADLIKRGYSVWTVYMLKDGTTEQAWRTDSCNIIDGKEQHVIWGRTKAPAYKGKNVPDILTSSVWAKTEKQAIKIVNEKRVQMIANNEW